MNRNLVLGVTIIVALLAVSGCSVCINQPISLISPSCETRDMKTITEKITDRTVEGVKPVVLEPQNPCKTCEEILMKDEGS